MSQNVGTSFQSKYQNNVEMVLQQQDSKILMADAIEVQEDAGADKVKVKDLVGNAAAQEADERHGDTKYANLSHDNVWIPKKNELYFAELIDNADKLATAIDLQGAYTQSGAGTVARAKDQRILEGFYGSIYSGKDGATVTAFPGAQTIAVTVGGAAGAQRMNVAKIRAATKMLTQAYVADDEPRFMVLTAEQNDDLLTEVPATSLDFKGSYKGEVDENGKIKRLLGWRFLHLELSNSLLGSIPASSLDASSYRKTPFWTRSGLRANVWQSLRTMVDPLPGKLGSWQVFAGTTLAATRTQAGKCGIILNSEA